MMKQMFGGHMVLVHDQSQGIFGEQTQSGSYSHRHREQWMPVWFCSGGELERSLGMTSIKERKWLNISTQYF